MDKSVNQAIVTMKQLDDVVPAVRGMDGFIFQGRKLSVIPTIEYKKGKEAAATTTAKGFGTDTGGWGQSGPSGQSVNPPSASATGASATTGLAPAPRLVAAGPSSNGGQVEGITSQLASMTAGGKDTWEISLEDSDFDDGWQPPKKDNKPPPIQKDEWYEAYEFVKSFAHYGGAILAVDVESWDRDQDYIIELGLAYVSWQKGNAAPPRVRAEHIIIEEHQEKRNGLYSPDAKDRFAFGKSRTLTEFESQVHLRMVIQKLGQGLNGQKQPVVFLFHNAAAEKIYFQLMNIDVLDNAPERIPASLLKPSLSSFKNGQWSGNIVLDTQRLWKAFLVGTDQEKDAPLALGKICKALGITTKYLHNAGNDALYTLKIFMKLAESENQARRRRREDADGGMQL